MSFLPILSAGITWLLLRWLLASRHAQWALDHPNHRSLHVAPVPRVGGLGVMAGVLLAWGVLGEAHLAICALLLAAMSLLDDVWSLPARWRFLGHVAVACLWVYWLSAAGGLAWAGVVVFLLVWMTNLYNFMDGSDGLAGGMALFGFGAYAAAAGLAGDIQLALACAAVAASALAFLSFNFHPARIFMGDAGSIPLGFTAGAIGLLGWQRGLWPGWYPLLVFSPFIVDATVTLVKRMVRKEKIWQAHRSHYYQRLVQMGWGHSRTAWTEYALMVTCAASALGALQLQDTVLAAFGIAWAVAYCGIAYWIDRRWARYA